MSDLGSDYDEEEQGPYLGVRNLFLNDLCIS